MAWKNNGAACDYGHLPAAKGTITLESIDILGRPSHEIANLGIGYVPQGREIFGDFTTEENSGL